MGTYKMSAYFNSTRNIDIHNLTHDVKRALRDSGVNDGLMTIFIAGGTAGVCLLENDSALQEEFKELVSEFVPEEGEKARVKRRSGSGGNIAHLRSQFLSPSLSIPIESGRLFLGPWQDVVVYDFDDQSSRREVLIHVLSEGGGGVPE